MIPISGQIGLILIAFALVVGGLMLAVVAGVGACSYRVPRP